MDFVLSYTAYSDFQLCPKRFFHKHVARDYPFEESEALVWGRAVHDAFKRRLNKPFVPFPFNMQNFEPIAATFLEFPHLISEQGMALTRQGEPRPWNTRPALVKAKADTVIFNGDYTSAMLVDYKTGKPREDPMELKFQAVTLAGHYPSLRKIKAAYYWANEARLGPTYDLTNELLPTMDLIKKTVDAIEGLFMCTDKRAAFVATPNTPFPCNWCACPGCDFADG
jgi:hypothetical protein